MNPVIEEFTSEYVKSDLPDLAVGDTIEVGVRIVEGERERVQRFSGTLIAKGGKGVDQRITVRRIVQGEGVECVFPLHSPRVDSIQIVRHGKVRRAKLYYLRDRVGKSVKLQERREKAGISSDKENAEAAAEVDSAPDTDVQEEES